MLVCSSVWVILSLSILLKHNEFEYILQNNHDYLQMRISTFQKLFQTSLRDFLNPIQFQSRLLSMLAQHIRPSPLLTTIGKHVFFSIMWFTDKPVR